MQKESSEYYQEYFHFVYFYFLFVLISTTHQIITKIQKLFPHFLKTGFILAPKRFLSFFQNVTDHGICTTDILSRRHRPPFLLLINWQQIRSCQLLRGDSKWASERGMFVGFVQDYRLQILNLLHKFLKVHGLLYHSRALLCVV